MNICGIPSADDVRIATGVSVGTTVGEAAVSIVGVKTMTGVSVGAVTGSAVAVGSDTGIGVPAPQAVKRNVKRMMGMSFFITERLYVYNARMSLRDAAGGEAISHYMDTIVQWVVILLLEIALPYRARNDIGFYGCTPTKLRA
jgi:hypothetical protein